MKLRFFVLLFFLFNIFLFGNSNNFIINNNLNNNLYQNIKIENNSLFLVCNFNILDKNFLSLFNDYFLIKKNLNYFDKTIQFYQLDTDKKYKENPFRRAEILFFGSLTFTVFGGWLFFSLFNFLIYNDTFGRLRREQFLILYLGSSVVSISVVLSDLFVTQQPKMKKIQMY